MKSDYMLRLSTRASPTLRLHQRPLVDGATNYGERAWCARPSRSPRPSLAVPHPPAHPSSCRCRLEVYVFICLAELQQLPLTCYAYGVCGAKFVKAISQEMKLTAKSPSSRRAHPRRELHRRAQRLRADSAGDQRGKPTVDSIAKGARAGTVCLPPTSTPTSIPTSSTSTSTSPSSSTSDARTPTTRCCPSCATRR